MKKITKQCSVCNKSFTVWFCRRKQKCCSRYCMFILQKGSGHPNWKGGKLIVTGGYVHIHMPSHPFCTAQGYVMEHRLKMEDKLKRYLDRTEVVHHINGIKNDNRIENLELCANLSEHIKTNHLQQLLGENNYNWNGGKVKKSCIICNAIYYVDPFLKNKSYFCSLKCVGIARSSGLFKKQEQEIVPDNEVKK